MSVRWPGSAHPRRRIVAPLDPVRAQARARRLAGRARMVAVHAVDPHGELLVPVVQIARGADVLVIRLPHRLESPNSWLWTHWRDKHRAKAAWAQRLEQAVTRSLPAIRLKAPRSAYPTLASLLEWTPPTNRPVVTVRRQVPSRRNFITDRENRYFAAKALVDCLVQAGFLPNDREADIDLQVTQMVDLERQDWTVITIDARALEQRTPVEAGE